MGQTHWRPEEVPGGDGESSPRTDDEAVFRSQVRIVNAIRAETARGPVLVFAEGGAIAANAREQWLELMRAEPIQEKYLAELASQKRQLGPELPREPWEKAVHRQQLAVATAVLAEQQRKMDLVRSRFGSDHPYRRFQQGFPKGLPQGADSWTATQQEMLVKYGAPTLLLWAGELPKVRHAGTFALDKEANESADRGDRTSPWLHRQRAGKLAVYQHREVATLLEVFGSNDPSVPQGATAVIVFGFAHDWSGYRPVLPIPLEWVDMTK